MYAMMMVLSAESLMAVNSAAGPGENSTSGLGENFTSGPGESAYAAVGVGPGTAAEGNPHRGPRETEQRDQRCALPSFIGAGMSSGEDTVLESTRTVDRYLVKPAAYYENRVTYRERPSATNVLRRRRPVAVAQRVSLLPYYVQRVDFADRDQRPSDYAETAVSLTADDVRRVLQRVYSEGVIAGGDNMAASGPNMMDSKVLPLKGGTEYTLL